MTDQERSGAEEPAPTAPDDREILAELAVQLHLGGKFPAEAVIAAKELLELIDLVGGLSAEDSRALILPRDFPPDE